MFDGKYGKVLTIIIIVLIVAIIGVLCFFGIKSSKKNKNDKEATSAIEEFNRNHNVGSTSTKPTAKPSTNATPNNIISDGDVIPMPDANPTSSTGGDSSSSSTSNKKTTYKGFDMCGWIEIPKTKIKYPILEKVTIKSLETAVAILYPSNAQLNEPGNVVIAGHNYKNDMFFSNNKNLKEGDKIYIADEKGRKVTYVVYKTLTTTPEDTSFYARDTGGVPEITLSTCSDDAKKRIIVFAKAQ